ncbi:MAG: hypothetical protein QHI38_05465 [Armatimonadota bacterium]|nr:hypothetical protein [Armatimonadota bacterium]
MKITPHAKSQAAAIVDQLSGLGVKFGGLAAALSFGYLVMIVIGGHLKAPLRPSSLEKIYLVQSVEIATRALVISGTVLIASLVLRYPREEVLGQILSLAGGALYFGGPPALGWFLQGKVANGSAQGLDIVNSVRTTGGIALLPGLTLLVRDAILRIWTRATTRRSHGRPVRQELQGAARVRPKILSSCWDMEVCREFVRRVCPAFAAKKSCWRIKTGCYCNERTILKAMTAEGKDNVHAKGIIEHLGQDRPAKQDKLSIKIKRERCRHCVIYAEHQRQKYRLLSPMVFPVVLAFVYYYYQDISRVVSQTLAKADRFLSFLTYQPKEAGVAIESDLGLLTMLAIVWLTIIAISYSLKALEYLVFELQV